MSLFCLNLKVKFFKESRFLSLAPNSSAGQPYNSKVSVFDELGVRLKNQLSHKLDLKERMGLVIRYSHTLGLNFLFYSNGKVTSETKELELKHLFSDKQSASLQLTLL